MRIHSVPRLPALRATLDEGDGADEVSRMSEENMRAEPDLGEIEQELGGQYQIVRSLGSGAFGTVYLARERQLHRLVAIKVLNTDRAWSDEERARLLSEARTIGQLSHPAIVPLLAFAETARAAYMVMPYVAGESLAERLRRDQRLDHPEVRRILIEIADALAYAHGAGVLHRDLKPENILLERAGAVGDDVPPRVRLIDFGVAAFPTRDHGAGVVHETWGTPSFMAPEQALGDPELDPRSELYSLGILGYLMLGGALPFEAKSAAERIRQQRTGPAVPLAVAAPDAPRDLVGVIDRCLAYEPEYRWRRARDVRDALMSGAPVGGEGATTMTVLSRRLRGAPRPTVRRVPAAAEKRRRPRTHVAFEVATDAMLSLRAFARRPLSIGLTVASLALGIGASSAMFSVVEVALLRPLPFPRPDRLVALYPTVPELAGHPTLGSQADRGTFSWPELWDVIDSARVLDGVAAYRSTLGVISGTDHADQLVLGETSPALFRALGVRPVIGSLFREDPGAAGATREVLLSEALWKGRFGARGDIVGTTVRINDEPHLVTGVLPASAAIGTLNPEAWVSRGRPPDPAAGRSNHNLRGAVARLRDGVSIEQARAEVSRILSATTPPDHGGVHGASVFALQDDRTRTSRKPLTILLAASALLLAVGCANVAAILLGAGLDRKHEIALRGALGASRGRIARQLLTESLVLAAIGGAAGILVAAVAMKGLVLLAPSDIPRIGEASLNGTVVLFALVIATVSGLLFGILPAFSLTRVEPASALSSSRGTVGGRARGQTTVVIAELALATVLLFGGALLTRTLMRLNRVDPGFRADELLSVSLAISPQRFRTLGSDTADRFVDAYVQRIVDGVAAVPGVRSVAVAATPPLTPARSNNAIAAEGWQPKPNEQLVAERRFVSANYFETLGMELVEGRGFTRDDDNAGAARVIVISEGLARHIWPRESALGKRVDPGSGMATVVGVAADVRDEWLDEPTRFAYYVPFRQYGPPQGGLVIRTSGDPTPLIGSIRSRIWQIDPSVAIPSVDTYRSLIERETTEQRYRARLMAVFALLAAVFAAMGVYGVTARSVARRTREIGIRVALGADPRSVVREVMAAALRIAVFGGAIGIVAALIGGRAVRQLLYDVEPHDPVSLGLIAVAVCSLALIAAIPPARRAVRVSPMEALRVE